MEYLGELVMYMLGKYLDSTACNFDTKSDAIFVEKSHAFYHVFSVFSAARSG